MSNGDNVGIYDLDLGRTATARASPNESCPNHSAVDSAGAEEMIDERVPTDVRFVSKVTMPGKVTWLMSDQLLLEYAADKGGYVQVKNGVRVLMVPKDEK